MSAEVRPWLGKRVLAYVHGPMDPRPVEGTVIDGQQEGVDDRGEPRFSLDLIDQDGEIHNAWLGDVRLTDPAGDFWLERVLGRDPELSAGFAADIFDEFGAYMGTVRLDGEDLDRCAHECNCTWGERITAGVLFLADDDPEKESP